MDLTSMHEWFDSFGADGVPNWCDKSGRIVPASKSSIRTLFTHIDHQAARISQLEAALTEADAKAEAIVEHLPSEWTVVEIAAAALAIRSACARGKEGEPT